MSNGKFSPIMTDVEAGPPEILKIVRCGRKGSCRSNCSCKKAGLKCTSTCKECHGITCNDVVMIDSDDEYEVDVDRNIFDILN
jgi:hypothetical protein